MKIWVVVLVMALFSTSLAKSKDGRKPKTKAKHDYVKEERRARHFQQSGPYLGPMDEVSFSGIREKPRIPYVDEETRSRRPRQSFITIQVPSGASYSGGNQGSHPGNQEGGGFHQGPALQFIGSPQAVSQPGSQGNGGIQQDTPVHFPGGSRPGNHPGNHPGNQGSVLIPGSVIISAQGVPAGNNGGNVFPPVAPGENIFFPGVPGVSPAHTSSFDGPGGLSSSSDSGLAGGLGGVYGGGYGFGLGGLIFGGPAGPVFAGNTALSESIGGNAENDELGIPNKSTVSPPQTPLFRPVPPRGSFVQDDREVTITKVNNQENRGITSTGYAKALYRPNVGKSTQKSPVMSNPSGETIGYVAFIFPRRNFNKPETQTTDRSKSTATQKSNDAPAYNPNAIHKPVANRITPFFVPVPVHIPIDRPHPVPVPKAYPVQILRPYPVAVPKPVPVPVPVAVPIASPPVLYEVAKPIPVPVEIPSSFNVQVPVLVGPSEASRDNIFLKPSVETRIIHKRSSKIAKPS